MSVRRLLYFGLQRGLGSRVWARYRELLSLESCSRNQFFAWQQSQTTMILNHAVSTIPFYRHRVTSPAGIGAFPLLSKEDVRSHFIDLMSPDLRDEYEKRTMRRLYGWKIVKTGGTTGEPTTVIHDADFRDCGRASRLYAQYLCGFPFGVPYFRLWGSMRDINQIHESLPSRIQSHLAGEIVLNAFRMELQDLEKYLDLINRSSVHYLMAYVDAACELARHARLSRKPVRSLKSVMSCAGTLTQDARILLSEVFGAGIRNQYGSREFGSIACECDQGGLHIQPHVLVEVVDENGNDVREGVTGRLLVTLLSNFSFPLIRYEIGDIGKLSSKACSCGRPFPLMEQIEGRSAEFLLSSRGAYVSPVYVRHLIGVVHNPGIVRNFQLVQHDRLSFELSVVLERDTSQDHYSRIAANLVRDLKAVLGDETDVTVSAVREIPYPSGGKFLYCANRYRSQRDESTLRS